MSKFNENTPVCDIVINNPLTARVFHQKGIDFCCGGDIPLQTICTKKNLSVKEVLAEIESIESDPMEFKPKEDTKASEIIDHILTRFHDVHKEEIPTLSYLMKKVATVHGSNHPELIEMLKLFQELIADIEPHMQKEERILFPLIKSLEMGETESNSKSFHCGSVEGPISQMENEHETVGDFLKSLRDVSHNYTLPQDACNSYRGLFAGLEKLEFDLHLHIHLENNVLHPLAKKIEINAGVA